MYRPAVAADNQLLPDDPLRFLSQSIQGAEAAGVRGVQLSQALQLGLGEGTVGRVKLCKDAHRAQSRVRFPCYRAVGSDGFGQGGDDNGPRPACRGSRLRMK